MASVTKIQKINEEAKLSRLLFSDADGLIEKFTGPIKEEPEEDVNVVRREPRKSKDRQESAAWHDEDDDIQVGSALGIQGRQFPRGGINDYSGQYANLIENKYKLLVGTPEWAQLDRKFEEDSDDDVLQSVGHISKVTSLFLPKGKLECKRLKYLNCDTGNEGPIINVIEFHPTSSVALVAGASGIASLVTVNGGKNQKLHSIKFNKFPIHCARFTKNGNEAYLGSTFPYFYMYDLMNAKALRVPLPTDVTKMTMFELSLCGKYIAIAGRFGEIHLICAKSRELLKTLKQGTFVMAMTFSIDSAYLFAHGTEGYVTVWNLSSLKVVHKWADEGCISGSCLTVSPSGQYLATGSAQGVVNIYELKDVLTSKDPKPKKAFLNLTTKITDLKFSPGSEILAFLSSHAKDSIRLAHIPSFQVFSNFPGLKPNMGFCSVVNFSPHTGYMSVGNNKKLAYLYRLSHYKNY